MTERLGNPPPGWRFAQRRPCSTCPFRTDLEFFLDPDKVEGVYEHLAGGGGHVCHNTYDRAPDTQPDGLDRRRQCAGALATLYNEPGGLPAWARMFDALGWWDATEIHDAPVHDSLDAWRTSMLERARAVTGDA